MRRRSVFITAALGVGLALGLVLGPAAWRGTASAQTQPPAPTQPNAPFQALQNLFLDKLAAALNIQRPALDTAIKNAGTSTADTAAQQGALTQAQADQLKARIQNGDLGALFGGRGGMPGGPQLPGMRQAMLDAAAKALNLTTDQLTTQLRSGQTIAQLAQARGTTEQAVTNAALAAAKAQLDQAVKAGTLTQAQADSSYARLQQEGARLLTQAGHGPGGRGGPRQAPGNSPAPANPPAPASPQAPATNSGA